MDTLRTGLPDADERADSASSVPARIRLKASAIEAAVEAGRMSRDHADELLADDRVPQTPIVGITFYPGTYPGDFRRAPRTIALVERAGRRAEVMVRGDHRGWLVTRDGEPVSATDPSVEGWHIAVRSARAHAVALAEPWGSS